MSAHAATVTRIVRRATVIAASGLIAGTVVAGPVDAQAQPAPAARSQDVMSCVSVGRLVSCASWKAVQAMLPAPRGATTSH
jgi:hypothetical protein